MSHLSPRNLKLTLAYDGTEYVGWQIQSNGRAIQEVVERAIQKVTGEPAKLLVAGRTDSGVHALGQVCNFTTHSPIPCRGFRRVLQHSLPDDILVCDVEDVPLDFHATWCAKRKHYRYVILNSPLPNPLVRRYAYHCYTPLDAAAMHAAAQVLVGMHDFRCFETKWPNKTTSVRTVMHLAVTRQAGWPVWSLPGPSDGTPIQPFCGDVSPRSGFITGTEARRASEGLEFTGNSDPSLARRASFETASSEFIWFDIVADGFLYNMVRAITGTLIRVGRGYWSPRDIRRIIDQQDRKHAGETAPPQGLYLVRVDYD